MMNTNNDLKTENTKSKRLHQRRQKKADSLQLPTMRKLHLKVGYVIGGVALLLLTLFFARVAIWEHGYIAAKEGSERAVATINEEVYEGGQDVDTTEPTENQVTEYIVAPDRPRYFTIPSLGISNAPIVELGVKANGELDTPRNIYHVGWYSGSSLPGSDGVSIIDAHGGSLGNGIFKNLPRIKVGAYIYIEMGDGTRYTYRVADVATTNVGEEANVYMRRDAFSSPQIGVGSITLITCTGDWWQTTQSYSQRFFVRAVLER